MNIKRPYQCSIAVYQLAKLRILEFHYDFLDKCIDRRDFEIIQMDTDSMYMAISGTLIDEIVQPELQEEYDNGGKAKCLLTSKYHDRNPGLFKEEFQGTRMITLTSECKCQRQKCETQFSCKGMSKKQKPLTWERFLEALNGSIEKAQNTGFRILSSKIVTYTQEKLGLSIYYDK